MKSFAKLLICYKVQQSLYCAGCSRFLSQFGRFLEQKERFKAIVLIRTRIASFLDFPSVLLIWLLTVHCMQTKRGKAWEIILSEWCQCLPRYKQMRISWTKRMHFASLNNESPFFLSSTVTLGWTVHAGRESFLLSYTFYIITFSFFHINSASPSFAF